MTKTKATAANKAPAGAPANKAPDVKDASAPTLIVLGYVEQKPCGARFTDTKADLVAKAAQLMELNVYAVNSPDLAALAKKLPVGRLYANGRGFVPNIRQDLYSKVVAVMAHDQQVLPGADRGDAPVATGLPRSWDDITPGHLVIAQETLEYGWWEAVVLDRNGDMFTLRFRDYPNLPKFVRHRSAVALMSPPAQ